MPLRCGEVSNYRAVQRQTKEIFAHKMGIELTDHLQRNTAAGLADATCAVTHIALWLAKCAHALAHAHAHA